MSVTVDGDWLVDQQTPDQLTLLRITKRLENARTRFQNAELVETAAFGKALVLDGSIQAAEADEWIYHESLVHPALCACPPHGRVAILGGGEGATLREVLRHRWVDKVTMVDIDAQVVEFCKKHLKTFHAGAFDDPRAELVIDDARGWIESQPDGLLAAIVFDITEPLDGGPAQRLFTREFYSQARRTLMPGGTLGMHAGPALLEATGVGEFFPRMLATLGEVFDQVQAMATHMYSYSDLWAFAVARAGVDPLPTGQDVDHRLKERVKGELKHFDSECQAHMTHLPKHLRTILEESREPYTDQDPAALHIDQ